MNYVNHSRGKMALASSIPFPGQLQSSRPQLNGVSSLFPSVSQLKSTFSSGKWHLFPAAKPMVAEEKGTWKAWLRTRSCVCPKAGGNCPHSVFTPGRTHSISNSRFAPRRAVLPKNNKTKTGNLCISNSFHPQPPVPGTCLALRHLQTHQRHRTLVRLPQGHSPLCSDLCSHE